MSTDKNENFLGFNDDKDSFDDSFSFEGSFSDLIASLNISEEDSAEKSFDFDFSEENSQAHSSELFPETDVSEETASIGEEATDEEPVEDTAPEQLINSDVALSDGLKGVLHSSELVDSPSGSSSGIDTKDGEIGQSKSKLKKASNRFEKETSEVKKIITKENDEYNEENWAPYNDKLRKNKVRFTIAMIVYTVLFIAAAFFGVRYLYKYLDAYEKTRPEHFMDELMPSMTGDDWYKLMREHCEIPASAFESQDDIYEAYYNTIVTSENSSYHKKVGAYSDEQPVYSIRLGNADMLLLKLVPDETKGAGFGYNYWKIGDVDILANGSGLSSASLEIDASANSKLYLNDVLLTPEYIVDDKVPYELSDLENRFDSQPYMVKYKVDGLYLNYRLCDENGKELTALRQEGNNYYYLLDQSEKWSFSVKAMSDMVVTVNGTSLSVDEAKSVQDYPVLAGLEDYVSDIPNVVTWSFGGLRTKPLISCTGPDGSELTPTILEDGTVLFDYPSSQELADKFSDRALGFINAYIKFATDDGNKTDTNYSKLVNYVLYKSDLHNYFYSSYLGGIHWASVLSYTVNEVGVDNFVSHGEDCFSCTGHFNITQKTYYETRDYETTYVLVFVKSGNSWYAVKMDDSAA